MNSRYIVDFQWNYFLIFLTVQKVLDKRGTIETINILIEISHYKIIYNKNTTTLTAVV